MKHRGKQGPHCRLQLLTFGILVRSLLVSRTKSSRPVGFLKEGSVDLEKPRAAPAGLWGPVLARSQHTFLGSAFCLQVWLSGQLLLCDKEGGRRRLPSGLVVLSGKKSCFLIILVPKLILAGVGGLNPMPTLNSNRRAGGREPLWPAHRLRARRG